MDEEKVSSSLYLKMSLLIFLFCLICGLLTGSIISIILLTPLGPILMRGLVSTTILTLACIYITSTIISCFLTYLVAKRLFKPLVELSKASIKVGKGDFTVSVDTQAVLPELHNVLENFNLMVKELSKVETLSNDFISNVSHEFKTPLSVIRSSTNILENSDLTMEERKKYIRQIDNSVEKLSSLVSNVLKICKLDNQELHLDLSTYRLDEQLRQCILLFERQIEEKELNLDINLDPCLIRIDKELIQHVWINLLQNAIKFSNQKGTIHIALTIKKNIEVVIQDNGIGMDEETIKHIFDRFFQGETSHSKDGNGLGLTIVSKILKLFKAKISVKSELNQGSTFTIQLPSTYLANQDSISS